MTHVVTESCIKCRYTDCVDVCPVDCFREGPNFLAIDPDECIDCAVCVAECPVNAIYAEEDVPGDQQHFTELNAELAKSWPSITKTKAPLPEADVRPARIPAQPSAAQPSSPSNANRFTAFIDGSFWNEGNVQLLARHNPIRHGDWTLVDGLGFGLVQQ